MTFGMQLRELRKKRGLSQGEFAQLVGTSQKVISDYERERTTPPKGRLVIIAQQLGVGLDQLLGINSEKKTLSPLNGSKRITLHGNKRSTKAMELFEQLHPTEQRVLLRQLKALVEGKKLHII